MDLSYYKNMEPFWGVWYIDEELGSGSFGKVFKIKREDYGETYTAALKVITIPHEKGEVDSLKSEGLDDISITKYYDTLVSELIKEFSLMSKLKGNSNIVSYEDHMTVKHDDGVGCDILIRMELLTPLTTYLKNNQINEQVIYKIGIDICKALEVCERHSIIHRDIKPENVFVSALGDFKLGDFGVSRVAGSATQGMSIKGTINYMAPEVFKGLPYNASVDIYSVGMMLYKLFNNNRGPFLPPVPEIISFEQRENAENLRMSGAELPDAVNASQDMMKIIRKATAYEYKERYSSPTEMRADLEAVMEGKSLISIAGAKVKSRKKSGNESETPISAKAVLRGNPGLTVRSDVASNLGTDAGTGGSAGKNKRNIIIGISAVAVLLVVALVAVLTGHKSETKTQLASQNQPLTVSVKSEVDISSESDSNESAITALNVKKGDVIYKDIPGDSAEIVASRDILDTVFTLDGVVYALPCRFSRFIDNGWFIASNGDTPDKAVAAGKYESVKLKKGLQVIELDVHSLTDVATTIEDSYVYRIMVESKETSFSMGNDITVGISLQDLVSRAGLPYNLDVFSAYYSDGDRTAYFNFDNDGTTVDYIKIENTLRHEVVNNSNLYPFSFSYAGTEITLPCGMSYLLDKGWNIMTDSFYSESIIPGRGIKTMKIGIGGIGFNMNVYNPYSDAKTVKECIVFAVDIDKMDGVTVLKSIDGSLNKNKIEKTLGKADMETSSAYRYYADTQKTKELTITFDNNDEVESASMKCQREYIHESIKAEVKRPMMLDNYVEPASLTGDNQFSFKLGDKMYSLPAPLNEFTDAGWYVNECESGLYGYNSVSLNLEKGDETVRVEVTNLDAEYMPVEYGVVTKIYVKKNLVSDFELPSGVTLKSTGAIGVQLGEGYKETSSGYKYVNSEVNGSVVVTVKNNTEKNRYEVEDITITNSDWNY